VLKKTKPPAALKRHHIHRKQSMAVVEELRRQGWFVDVRMEVIWRDKK